MMLQIHNTTNHYIIHVRTHQHQGHALKHGRARPAPARPNCLKADKCLNYDPASMPKIQPGQKNYKLLTPEQTNIVAWVFAMKCIHNGHKVVLCAKFA